MQIIGGTLWVKIGTKVKIDIQKKLFGYKSEFSIPVITKYPTIPGLYMFLKNNFNNFSVLLFESLNHLKAWYFFLSQAIKNYILYHKHKVRCKNT